MKGRGVGETTVVKEEKFFDSLIKQHEKRRQTTTSNILDANGNTFISFTLLFINIKYSQVAKLVNAMSACSIVQVRILS